MNMQDTERFVSVQLIRYDLESIYSLLQSEHNSIYTLAVIPYYALFVHSFQEFANNTFFTNAVAGRIKDIRNHIKSYSSSFGKTKRNLLHVDEEQDRDFKSQLRFNFLKALNVHYNLGTYWTKDRRVIANTQQLADFLGINSFFESDVAQQQKKLGYAISLFVASARVALSSDQNQFAIHRAESNVKVEYYCDLNTNRRNGIFAKNNSKELNQFFLNLLCNMNFVKYILSPLFPENNYWVFRITYIVTYYTHYALQRLVNYCENNSGISIDHSKITHLLSSGNPLFISKLRNGLMHYDLENRGLLSRDTLSKPFFGIIENTFEGMDFDCYLTSLKEHANCIIKFLEEQFDCENIILKKL